MKVILSVPSLGWIRQEVAACLFPISQDDRVQVEVRFACEKPYEANQNAVAEMVRQSDADWWMSIDSDNPPTKNIVDLCFVGVDLVACPTPVWKSDRSIRPYYWNALDGDNCGYKTHTPTVGLQPVDVFGSGCFVCHRRVLEAVERPFETIYNRNGIKAQGPDMTFCQRAKAAGFQPYVHYDYPCDHIVEVDLLRLANFAKVPHPE